MATPPGAISGGPLDHIGLRAVGIDPDQSSARTEVGYRISGDLQDVQ